MKRLSTTASSKPKKAFQIHAEAAQHINVRLECWPTRVLVKPSPPTY